MRLMLHPGLAERLAAAYALGTLRGGARRRLESLARENPALRALVLTWQERLASMTELQRDIPPDPNVWKRIEIQLRAEHPAPAPVRRAGAWWRPLLAGGLAGVLAFVLASYLGLQPGGREAALATQSLALLQDERAAPVLLLALDADRGDLTVRRLDGFSEPAGRVLELWAVPAAGTPRSLGVLPRQPISRLQVPHGLADSASALAVSLEPPGGAPAGGGPTGPVLFQGRWLARGGA